MKNLSFIVIGAAKAGTTTVYEWLKNHPELYLPQGKELPFYTENQLYQAGINKYLEANFPGAPKDKMWGKVTPQYMSGVNSTKVDEIAKRIHKTNPGIKLIAILRNPVERAHSDYKMLVRRGYIKKKTFSEVLDDYLAIDKLEDARDNPESSKRLVVAGEYSRIIAEYLQYFDRKQLLILFSDDLAKHPKRTYHTLCDFLEIDNSHVPDNIYKRYHVGGASPRIKLLTPSVLYRVPLVEIIWKRLMPYNFRRRVNYTINQWNNKPDKQKLARHSNTYKRLARFYKEDTYILEGLLERRVPWRDLIFCE